MKIVVIASLAYSLVNFRGALIADMVEAGADVVACAPEDDPEVTAALGRMGVGYRQIPMQRADRNPLGDLRTLFGLARMLREERPDAVLAYTQKPIIYGGIAARLVSRARFFAMVSGLGYVFTDDGETVRPFLRQIVSILYRAAVRRAAAVIVFNNDDRAEMRKHGILRDDHPVVQVPGSGIDTIRFAAQPVPAGPPVFLMIARLLRDKGLLEFVTAARALKLRYPDAKFQLLGPVDPNPTGIGAAVIDAWAAEGIVDYLGETRDVRPYLNASSVFVLPSYYREGLPRTILEALATGRAVITTDAPGCRETIEPGRNGFLVPVRDASALGQAMEQFLLDATLAASMGAVSREIAVTRFDVGIVNAILLATLGVHGRAAAASATSAFDAAAVCA